MTGAKRDPRRRYILPPPLSLQFSTQNINPIFCVPLHPQLSYNSEPLAATQYSTSPPYQHFLRLSAARQNNAITSQLLRRTFGSAHPISDFRQTRTAIHCCHIQTFQRHLQGNRFRTLGQPQSPDCFFCCRQRIRKNPQSAMV